MDSLKNDIDYTQEINKPTREGGITNLEIKDITLKLIYFNAQSIVNKRHEFELLVNEHKPDIIGISESWTSDQITEAELRLDGYYIFRRDRKGKRGGGVLLYIANHINAKEVKTDVSAVFKEYIFCEIELSGNKFKLALCYRPPNTTLEEDKCIKELIKNNCKGNIVIMGDMNYPNINWKEHIAKGSGKKFLKTIDDCFLQQMVLEKTCGENILDLVLTSNPAMISNVEIQPGLGRSAHDMIFYNIILYGKIEIEPKKLEYNYRKGDYIEMSNKLADINWDGEFLDGEDINVWYSNLKTILENLYAKYIPFKVRKGWRKKVWITRDVVTASRRKKKAWIKYRRNKSEENKRHYDDSKKTVVNEVNKAVKNHEENLANNCKDSSKAFFKYIKSNSKGGEHIQVLKNNKNEWVKDDSEKANLLNHYFRSVFVLDDGRDMIGEGEEGFSFDLNKYDITEEAIEDKLSKVKPDKSAGPDGIHPKVLYELRNVLKKPLKVLFIKSLETEEVPVAWREANVVPLFKKGSKSDVGNYRPVSITSVAGRIFEQIIKDKLMEFLEENGLLRDSQFGFRKGRSCASNLIIFWDYITEQLDKGYSIDVILLDLAKAFDKVSHKKLIHKLKCKGITGKLLAWITNWLKNRKQGVVLGGKHSELERVESGVPQGSVLGPLLFLVYIDDLEEGIEGKFSKFADDSKLGRVVDTEDDCRSMQRDLDRIFNWSVKWQMELNLDKCVVMHLGLKNRKYQYTIKETALKSVEEERDLGVIVDNKLRFKKQCAKAASKANQVLGMIKRNVKSRNKEVIVKLYKGLVRPLLEYSIQAWRPYKKGDIKVLERVQKRATKMIIGLRNKSYDERLKDLMLPSLEDRRARGDMIMTYKMINGFEKVEANRLWMTNNNRTRGHNSKLKKTRCRLDIRKYAFSMRVVDQWNRLKEGVVMSTSVNNFKNAYDAIRSRQN